MRSHQQCLRLSSCRFCCRGFAHNPLFQCIVYLDHSKCSAEVPASLQKWNNRKGFLFNQHLSGGEDDEEWWTGAGRKWRTGKFTRGDPAHAGGEDFEASKGGDMPTRLGLRGLPCISQCGNYFPHASKVPRLHKNCWDLRGKASWKGWNVRVGLHATQLWSSFSQWTGRWGKPGEKKKGFCGENKVAVYCAARGLRLLWRVFIYQRNSCSFLSHTERLWTHEGKKNDKSKKTGNAF